MPVQAEVSRKVQEGEHGNPAVNLRLPATTIFLLALLRSGR